MRDRAGLVIGQEGRQRNVQVVPMTKKNTHLGLTLAWQKKGFIGASENRESKRPGGLVSEAATFFSSSPPFPLFIAAVYLPAPLHF